MEIKKTEGAKVKQYEIELANEPNTRVWSKTKGDWVSKLERKAIDLDADIDKLMARTEIVHDYGAEVITERQKRQHRAMSKSFAPDDRLETLAEIVDAIAEALARKLRFPRKQVAKILQYWAKRVPIDEREDLIQELTEKLLRERPANLKLAFVTMKRDTIDYIRRYYCFEKSKLSLETQVTADATLGEVIPDTFEFTEVVNLKLDTARLLAEMGAEIRGIVGRKLAGVRLTNAEKTKLEDFGRKHLDFIYA